jgi:hypothetical protein
MYHLAGITFEKYCNATGILSIGNNIPERSKVGRRNTIAEIRIASSWVDTRVETRIPRLNDTIIYNSDIITTHNILPLTGTCNR